MVHTYKKQTLSDRLEKEEQREGQVEMRKYKRHGVDKTVSHEPQSTLCVCVRVSMRACVCEILNGLP